MIDLDIPNTDYDESGDIPPILPPDYNSYPSFIRAPQYDGYVNTTSTDDVLPTQKAVKTYVDTLDSNTVHKTRDETIAGDKSFTGTTAVVTPAVSDNSTKPATTAYIETKFQVVSALPASPDPNTYYFIPES